MEHRVAITGIGAVTPLGNTAKETWEGMVAGRCGIGPITHFDTEGFKVKVAAEVKGFDGVELLGKQEASHLDLYAQYALVASDEAMADSGLAEEGAIDHERLGVYVGSGTGGINAFADNVHTIAARGPRRASPFMITMMIANMAAGNIAIRHKALGPTLPVVTACATSAHAIGEAFRAIKHGYADAILAGGAEAAIMPRVHRRLHELPCPHHQPRPPPRRAAPSTPTVTASSWARVPACSSSRSGSMPSRAAPTSTPSRGLRATPTTPITSPPPTRRPPASPAPSAWPSRRVA